MSCGARAILMITRVLEDTATNVARARIDLVCDLAAGHAGAHRDERNNEQWEGAATRVVTILRSEDELPGSDGADLNS